MKILMVTPYPPLRDGIASYAVQTVVALRTEGHDVTVLSPGPSAAHLHLNLVGPRGAAALARRARGYDQVIIQFHPDFFYPVDASNSERAVISSALAVAFRLAGNVEVRLHEIDYRTGYGMSPAAIAARRMWAQVDKIVVHTEGERADFLKAFRVKPDQVQLTEHGGDFVKYTSADRASARRSLRVPADAVVFVSIGFIQPHKGFDRGVEAFGRVGSGDDRFYVVGSIRVDEPGYLAYMAELSDLIERTPGAELRQGYVSDELFDRWIVAADCVVLPYRAIWSSSVIERAKLYDTPVIVTNVGGLRAQAERGSDITVVENDEELTTAIASRVDGVRPQLGAARSSSYQPAVDTVWPDGSGDLRERLQSEIIRRGTLRRGRGLGAVDAPGGRAGSPMADRGDARAAVAKVAPIPLYSMPTTAGSGARSYLKKVVRKLTAWETREVAHQLNLQKLGTDKMIGALTDQLAQLQARVAELEAEQTR